MSNIDFPSPYYRSMQKKYDKARFDCFKEYLGCQNADDVYKVITTYDGITRYNGIVDAINSKIAAYTGCSYSEFRNAEQWRTPQDASEELLEYIRKRWDEIYNDEPEVDQKTADANTVSQTPADSKTFDTDHFPIGSAVPVPNNQPGIPLTEFAERLIALEHENENLKKGIAFAISMGVRASGMFYHKPDGEEYVWPGVGNFTKELGLPEWALQISKDKIELKFANKEDKHEQTNERTDPSQSV